MAQDQAVQETKSNLLRLFDRPQTPLFVPRDNDKNFKLPLEYLNDRYQSLMVDDIQVFAASDTIEIEKVSIPSSFDDILELDRNENFSLFIPKHKKIAGKLIEIFMGMENVKDLLSMAAYAHEHVNPYLFNYAYTVALLHRPDTQDMELPSFIQSFPDKYLDSRVFMRAREEAAIVKNTGSRMPIRIPKDYTASDLEEEHRVAYFREDLGINLHHWHWHLVYPFEAGDDREKALQIVNKNRRGELFYYMHQQVLARYNIERLCNKLPRVKRITDLKAPIEEAYFPKLDSQVAGRAWPGRVANQKLTNINREADQIRQDVEDLRQWRDRIIAAINSGYITNEQGKEIRLTENEGIDILGNLIESSLLSENRVFYGDLHNMGHILISYIHDPDHRHLESFACMGDTATAMRDPIFYRWHSYIDEIFQRHKVLVERYKEDRLTFPMITVTEVKVRAKNTRENLINTFWQQSDVDMSRGLDFGEGGSVYARFTHLQHQKFTYEIKVNNQAGGPKMGTCRIFLAPKFDERGNTWLFKDQRLMFIELDRFPVTLKQGVNTITRESSQSSVTIPFDRTFRNLNLNRPAKENTEGTLSFNFCGCGWPDHMLIPKGTQEGYPCQLFVMVSDYEKDKVNQTVEGECNDSFSYCGLKNKLYPDRQSMGYPFDRMPRDGVNTLQEFLTPNMRVQEVSVKFNDRVVGPKKN